MQTFNFPPQGGGVLPHQPQGGREFSPAQISDLIVWLEAGKGLTFNGAGNDLIDEDFDPDPSWTQTGPGTVTVSGGILSVGTKDAEGATFLAGLFASQTEVWLEYEINTGALDITPGRTILFTG